MPEEMKLSIIDIFLLGLLWSGPKHGYEINTLLADEALSSIARIGRASVYASINRLIKKGAVLESKSKEPGKLERRKLIITSQGRHSLQEAIEESIKNLEVSGFELNLVLLFIDLLPEETINNCLSEREARLKEMLDKIEMTLSNPPQMANQSTILPVIMRTRNLLKIELESLVDFRNYILDRTRAAGEAFISGKISNIELFPLLKKISITERTGTLQLTSTDGFGWIYFENGQPKKLYCSKSKTRQETNEERLYDASCSNISRLEAEFNFIYSKPLDFEKGILIEDPLEFVVSLSRSIEEPELINKFVPNTQVILSRNPLFSSKTLEKILRKEELQLLEELDDISTLSSIAKRLDLAPMTILKIAFILTVSEIANHVSGAKYTAITSINSFFHGILTRLEFIGGKDFQEKASERIIQSSKEMRLAFTIEQDGSLLATEKHSYELTEIFDNSKKLLEITGGVLSSLLGKKMSEEIILSAKASLPDDQKNFLLKYLTKGES